jgi:hypothetical protein
MVEARITFLLAMATRSTDLEAFAVLSLKDLLAGAGDKSGLGGHGGRRPYAIDDPRLESDGGATCRLGKVRIASDLNSRLITALALLGQQTIAMTCARSTHPGPGAFICVTAKEAQEAQPASLPPGGAAVDSTRRPS